MYMNDLTIYHCSGHTSHNTAVHVPTWPSSSFDAVRKLVHISHNLLPGLIHLYEHLSLIGKLPLDVWSTKDRL